MTHARAFTCAVLAVAVAALAAESQSRQETSEPSSREVAVPSRFCALVPQCGRPVSPDGRYFAYRDNVPGKGPVLMVRDLRSGQSVSVVPAAPDAAPSGDLVWSRDSRRVAYRWMKKGGDGTAELRSIAADGTDMRVLAPEGVYRSLEDWSPDSTALLATVHVKDTTDPHEEAVILSLATGSRRVLGREIRGAAFSPDGRRIVYTKSTDGWRTRDVRLINATGDGDRALVASAADEAALSWSPDGRDVLFTKDEDLWVVGVGNGNADGQPRRLKKNIGRASVLGVTAAGDLYYSVFENLKVFRVPLDLATGKVTGAPSRVGVQNLDSQETPTWSPNGRELAFQAGAGGELIAIVSVDTGERREIRPDIDWLEDLPLTPFSWTPDGRSFFVDGGPMPEGTARPKGAFRVDARTGDATMVVSKPVNPVSVSHVRGLSDGRSVIYLDTWRRVVIRDLENSDERVVFDGGATTEVDSLALSPDGRTVAFRDPKKGVVYVVPLTGGAPREVAKFKGLDGWSAAVAWSADGRFLIYGSPKSGAPGYELWRVPVNGGEPERVGLASDSEITNVAVRPGGRELAVVMHSGEPPGMRVIEKLLPAASSAPAGAR